MLPTFRRLAIAAVVSSISLTSAHAFDASDCKLLKAFVADSADSFAAMRTNPTDGDFTTSYDVRQTFSEAHECGVVIGETPFNENMTCYFGDIDIATAAAFVEECLGDTVKATPVEHPEQSARYEFTQPSVGSISLWRLLPDLTLRIDRLEPNPETPEAET